VLPEVARSAAGPTALPLFGERSLAVPPFALVPASPVAPRPFDGVSTLLRFDELAFDELAFDELAFEGVPALALLFDWLLFDRVPFDWVPPDRLPVVGEPFDGVGVERLPAPVSA
jgi:hypothetical protein